MLFSTQRKIVLGTDQENIHPLIGHFSFQSLSKNHIKGRERAFAFARCGLLLLAFLAAFGGGFYWPRNMGKLCTSATSVYCTYDISSHSKLILELKLLLAPVMEDMNPAYHDTRFNASLHLPTLYGQEPSTRVDQAWLELGANCKCATRPWAHFQSVV